MKNTTSKQIHLITVNNDVGGKRQIFDLRAQMRTSGSPLKLTLYGRGHRFGKGRIHVNKYSQPTRTDGWNNDFQSRVPLSKAQRIAVYVTGRGKPSYD